MPATTSAFRQVKLTCTFPRICYTGECYRGLCQAKRGRGGEGGGRQTEGISCAENQGENKEEMEIRIKTEITFQTPGRKNIRRKLVERDENEEGRKKEKREEEREF